MGRGNSQRITPTNFLQTRMASGRKRCIEDGPSMRFILMAILIITKMTWSHGRLKGVPLAFLSKISPLTNILIRTVPGRSTQTMNCWLHNIRICGSCQMEICVTSLMANYVLLRTILHKASPGIGVFRVGLLIQIPQLMLLLGRSEERRVGKE